MVNVSFKCQARAMLGREIARIEAEAYVARLLKGRTGQGSD